MQQLSAHGPLIAAPTPSGKTSFDESPRHGSGIGRGARSAWLRDADRRPDRRPGAGSQRCRPSGLGPDRLRQDRRLRHRHRPDPARRRGALRWRRRPKRAGHRADPRTGDAGTARIRMALPRYGGAHRVLRRRHGHAPGTARAGAGRQYRRRHARPPARPHHARLARHFGPARRGARRGRRDARPRLPRGSRIHPRRRTGRPPHAAVLGDRAESHRATGQALPARCAAHHRDRRRRPARRHRIPHDPGGAVRARERHHQYAAVLRCAEHAGLLRHARSGAGT